MSLKNELIAQKGRPPRDVAILVKSSGRAGGDHDDEGESDSDNDIV
jgi:hypothetical protein